MMAQEIEIEFKSMLTEDEFLLLLEELPFPKTAIEQTNYYFETRDFALKKAQSALRIRKINNRFTLTLKEPHEKGILETHDALDAYEARSWIENHPIAKKHVHQQLQNLNVEEEELHYYGSLKTIRYSFDLNEISYMLDQSMYHGVIDYELEIEAPNDRAGEQAMRQVCEAYDITFKKAEPKIARFFKLAHTSIFKRDPD